MPRQRRVPGYRLHKPSNLAFVEIRGRRQYLGRYDTDESRERYYKLIAESFAPTSQPRRIERLAAIQVKQLAAEYLLYARDYYVKHGKQTSQVAHIVRAVKSLTQLHGSRFVTEFDTLALQEIQNYLIAEGRLARPTINRRVRLIRGIFKWGVARQIVPATVWHGLQAVAPLKRGRTQAREPAPIRPIDDATIEATIPFMPPTVAAMVRLQRLTGMRPGEVCTLRPCDIDRSAEVWLYRPPHHKTEHHGEVRRVPIGRNAQAALTPYLLRDAKSFCFTPGTTPKGRRLQPMRERFDKDAYNRAIARACERAFNMPKELRRIAKGTTDTARLRAAARDWRARHCWSPNQLRHALATEARRRGGLETAQALLGHAHVDTTQIYAERLDELAVEYARSFG